MHPPTSEQSTIIHHAKTSQSNLLISALAGAAKTTTLEMICHALPGIPILSLAFNKRIADEMTKRLPTHVECRTMNGMGHRVWGAAVGRRLVVDSQKMATILKNVIPELSREDQRMAWAEMGDTLKWLRFAKRDGYVPPFWRGRTSGYHIDSFAEWTAGYDDEPSSQQHHLIDETLSASIEASYAGGIDFDDQIYMPVIFGGSWPRYPLVLIDEFQDLNELQHEMLAKLVVKRLIGVGDPWQSIYGFRGAKQNGMSSAKERWDMTELPLSITFRVPRKGVENVRSRVPHMQWAPNAPNGIVATLAEWRASDIPDGAAIICRNNAPLFSCALALLRSGRGIRLVGMDIGPGLLRILRGLGSTGLEEAEVHQAINRWTTAETRKAKRPGTIADRAECLHVLAEDRRTLADAILWTESIFKQAGPIQLLSGHKAKGLEWDTVFHLDPWRIPSKFAKPDTEEWEQELNVRYVVETRFKKELYLVDMGGFR